MSYHLNHLQMKTTTVGVKFRFQYRLLWMNFKRQVSRTLTLTLALMTKIALESRWSFMQPASDLYMFWAGVAWDPFQIHIIWFWCQVPKWAEGTNLRTALLKQCYMPPDLDQIFATVEMPDLSTMFVEQRKRWIWIWRLDDIKIAFSPGSSREQAVPAGNSPQKVSSTAFVGFEGEKGTLFQLWSLWNMPCPCIGLVIDKIIDKN